jgi:hypothetical protein
VIKPDRLLELMKNKYGNFVILKMLSIIEVEDKQALMNALYKCLQHLTIVKYRSRWITFINENPLKIPNIPSAQGIQTFKPSQFKNTNIQQQEAQDLYLRGQNQEFYGNVVPNVNEMYGGGQDWEEPIQNIQQQGYIQPHLNLNMPNQYQPYYYQNQGNQNQNQMINLQHQKISSNSQYGGFFNPNIQQQQQYMQPQQQYQQQIPQQQYQQQLLQQQQQQQYGNKRQQNPTKQVPNPKWHEDKDHHGTNKQTKFDKFG